MIKNIIMILLFIMTLVFCSITYAYWSISSHFSVYTGALTVIMVMVLIRIADGE